ncbi:hypothetical protein [Shewanella surugensis]|uniref:DUF559 domain-containing protein n=1 Tax=Shewanella surugensis TaxID=212020 RepID=A0ABT0L6U9_9GAMM|nr:hypothetical protein [Shewanella surugensis]MCL1123413.1 hypothetical protein [Shewanella surugensis]
MSNQTMSLYEYRVFQAAKTHSKRKSTSNTSPVVVAHYLMDLPEYDTEVMFHPKRKWRFDFAWPQWKIALEVHGGVFKNGRHTRGTGFTEDRVKMNSAQLLGWIVIEATTEQVKNGLMVTWVNDAIARRTAYASD